MSVLVGRFGRGRRLLRREEFRYVGRHGRRVEQPCFVMLVAGRGPAAGEVGTRLGVTVSQRVGNAVVRNRVKRRIREWFRRERPRMRQNLDIVVIARPAAAGSTGAETIEALGGLARAARVLA